jgi:hypothetical protein
MELTRAVSGTGRGTGTGFGGTAMVTSTGEAGKKAKRADTAPSFSPIKAGILGIFTRDPITDRGS